MRERKSVDSAGSELERGLDAVPEVRRSAPLRALGSRSLNRREGELLAPAEVRAVQGGLGNRIVGAIQARLKVGAVHDRYEQEADRIADAVMRAPDAPTPVIAGPGPAATISRLTDHGSHGHGCACDGCTGPRRVEVSAVQRHAGHEEEEELRMGPGVQRHADPAQHPRGCSCPGCSSAPVQRHAGHVGHAGHEEEEEGPWTRHLPGVQRHAAHSAGCGCSGCGAVQRRSVAADGSFVAGQALGERVQRLHAGGEPLPQSVRGDMERRFGADFSEVRIHTGGEAHGLNRELGAHAFTHGRHIAFASGQFDPGSARGRWLLAHELVHTIQQTGAQAAVGAQRVSAGPGPVLQRHSTHEHFLLGTLRPTEIADIPLIREQWQQAKEWETKQKSKPKKKEKEKVSLLGSEDLEEDEESPLDAEKYEEVIHLLEQEMERVLTYQKRDVKTQLLEQEEDSEEIGTVRKVRKVGMVDPTYQVPLVRIPTKDGSSVICTYGELNTLADMYGTIEDLANTPAESVVRMLQGVRQRVYIVLHKLYEEIGGSAHKKAVKLLRPDTSFAGAIGFSGKEKGGLGAVGALGGYEKATKNEDAEFDEFNASAALARNACHFAPETWYTWRRYHEKARDLAGVAYALKQANADLTAGSNPFALDPKEIQAALKRNEVKRREATNLALVYSGFGDHYLQDAYAAGHLIDKTRVMQWFFDWQKDADVLKDNPDYAMIRAVASQDLKSNPQQMQNVRGGVKEKIEHVGIVVEDHIRLLMWWRAMAIKTPKLATMTAEDVVAYEAPGVTDEGEAGDLLEALAALGIAKKGKKGDLDVPFTLDPRHIAVADPFSKEKKAPYKSELARSHEDEAREFYYVAYAKFLDQSHLQLITNYLHNVFCAQGLEVETQDGESIGRIYGDATMLSAGGQAGLFHSATTGEWARQAILEIIETGSASHSTEDIDARFPRKVAADWDGKGGKKPLPIEDWWTALEKEARRKGGLFDAGSQRLVSTFMKRGKTTLTEGEQIITPPSKLEASEPIPEEDRNPFKSLEDIAQPAHDPVF